MKKSRWKRISSELGEKYAQIKHRLQAKTVLNWWILMQQGWTFSLENALLWIMDSYFGQK